jgi:outer membrane protein OmpA-like peptidoglycan-associated protein
MKSARLTLFGALFGAAVALTACSKKDDVEDRRAAEAAVSAQLPSEPASLPTEDATGASMPGSDPAAGAAPADAAALPTVAADFDVSSVPLTTASLPPFPFFKDPEGLENDLKGPDASKPFDRHFFIAGGKAITEEGKLALFKYAIEYPPSGRKYSVLEFLRNYDNAIAALGGKKVSAVQFTDPVVAAAGGRDAIEKYFNGAPPLIDAEHYSYLIRTADKEYWIHVSAGATIPQIGFVTVLEKQAMQSSLGFLDAAAMKKALDEKGRVALYINFDLDKSTLRPDAQPIVEEIHKLLASDSSLALSIEGHTDSTGKADHNRELATARARSVLGALVGLGVDASRLSSKGFGPDKPVADNATEEGRAKNRRVELVKTN